MNVTRRNLLRVALPSLMAPVLGQVQAAPRRDHDSAALWLLLNHAKQRLQVMQGNKSILHYSNVSWGRGGIGLKTRVGDNVTPVGEFRVRWINERSQWRTFFGFDYPNPNYAQLGLMRGDLNNDQYGSIIEASRRGHVPLQNTPIGGAIGIHGLGDANTAIHRATNWTQGCIALDNAQIDHLAQFVTVGTRVVIGPETATS